MGIRSSGLGLCSPLRDSLLPIKDQEIAYRAFIHSVMQQVFVEYLLCPQFRDYKQDLYSAIIQSPFSFMHSAHLEILCSSSDQ